MGFLGRLKDFTQFICVVLVLNTNRQSYKLVYSGVFDFFSFLWLIIFQKKNLFYDDTLVLILNNSILFQLLQAWCICVFWHFPHQLKKIFFKMIFWFFVSSVLILIYGLNQDFWLNLITLCIFFNTSRWFTTRFKFPMCITSLSISCKFGASFSTFSVFGRTVGSLFMVVMVVGRGGGGVVGVGWAKMLTTIVGWRRKSFHFNWYFWKFSYFVGFWYFYL